MSGDVTTAVEESRIHVIAIGDTLDPTIGSAARKDLERIESLFRETVRDAQLRFSVVQDSDVTLQGIDRRIRSSTASVAASDALVCYTSTHGSFSGEHRLDFPRQSEFLGRTRLRSMLHSVVKPRLTILLTDACSSFLDAQAALAAESPVMGADATLAAMRTLFLLPSGFLDINSSMPGQIALADRPKGSYFTFSMAQIIKERLPYRLTWVELLALVDGAVSRQIGEAKAKNPGHPVLVSAGQSIHRMGLPLEDDFSFMSRRLGILFEQNAASLKFGCVAVGEVYYDTSPPPGFPSSIFVKSATGQKLRQKPKTQGISHYAGRRIRTIPELKEAILAGGPEASLRVMNLANGRISDEDYTLWPRE